jgi:hypothetical protein
VTKREIRQKIVEAENWLSCSCVQCRALRAGLGIETIKGYIARLKKELQEVL